MLTQYEYMQELGRKLATLPEDERENALAYYNEYLQDAGNDVSEAIKRLGPPAEVAANILADFAVKKPVLLEPSGTPEKYGKYARRTRFGSGLKATWAVILGIFALPIGLPVAMALFLMGLSLIIVLVTVIGSFMGVGAACGASAIVLLVVGIMAAASDFAIGIGMIGAAFVAAGLSIVLVKLSVLISRKGFGGIRRMIGKSILRRR